jgi:hypothetical protein
MTYITLTCPERVALRELEFAVLPPQPLWRVLNSIHYHAQGEFYVGNFKPTQIGQLRAYLRNNASGDGRLWALHDKLEAIYQDVDPLYQPGRNA